MIEARALTRHFTSRKQTVEAVRGLDLTVERGELVALLGPNGAGKSTTLRMLTTLIPPTSGTATVAGYDVGRDPREVRRRIGYIGQGNGAGHNQRARDELVSQGLAYGLDRNTARDRAVELAASLGLAELADRKVSTLSGGQRRRLDIAMGLIHGPELLFLDEPSTGLDPQNRANLQEHVVALRERFGTTVVLTTHYLDEADSLAERVVVVDHGTVVADDTPDRLKAVHASDRVVLGFRDHADAACAVRRVATAHPRAAVRHDGTHVYVEMGGGTFAVPALLADLAATGTPTVSVEVARPTLDDVFLNLTGRSLREGTGTDQSTPSETEEVVAA
ncbi:MAG: ATP-binding cassette domain-containing protein [Nocardioidaceae bacterium]|nr:ATP-binding cassette domain-containing protein [Nocardioidaceae bacterium]NUS52984.1 ATP-binding cassette domain-containing protein [Nocardioidaceae bacterium]